MQLNRIVNEKIIIQYRLSITKLKNTQNTPITSTSIRVSRSTCNEVVAYFDSEPCSISVERAADAAKIVELDVDIIAARSDPMKIAISTTPMIPITLGSNNRSASTSST